MLADVEEEEEQDVICFDDITGKELPWHAVRKARELELKYVRDLGVFEKVDETEAVARYGITPVDTKWVDTDKAFEAEPMQIRSRMCAREFKSDDPPDLYAGTPPWDKETFFNHAHRCVTCVLQRKVPETRADTATSGRQNGHRRWESRTCTERGTQPAIGNAIGKSTLRIGDSTETQLEESVPPQRRPSVGFDTR